MVSIKNPILFFPYHYLILTMVEIEETQEQFQGKKGKLGEYKKRKQFRYDDSDSDLEVEKHSDGEEAEQPLLKKVINFP